MKTSHPTPEESQKAEARERASERRNFFLSAALSFDGHKAVTARVRNLSGGGMMAELSADPEPEVVSGERLTVELRNIGRVKGEVAWVRGRRCGIRFDYEIDPELARKPVGGGEGTPDFVKPVLVPNRSLRYVEGLKGH